MSRVVEVETDITTAEKITLNDRRQHYAHARKVKPLRTLGHSLIAGLDPVPRLRAADLLVEVGWANRIRRDSHNLMPTLKALIDGMTEAGLLPDDDDRHLTGPDLRPYLRGDKGHVHLHFTFTEREPLP